MKQKLKLFFAAIASTVLIACQPQPQAEMTTLNGKTMGTTYTVKYIAQPHQKLPESHTVQQQIDDLLKEVNRQMSTYDKNSEISQFNQMPASANAMPISADFATVLAEAIRLNGVTEGALDVTVGALVNLWGFGADKSVNKSPTPAELAKANQMVGLDKLLFRQPENAKATLGKTVDGVYVDLSAIAKGFGVDKVAQHLDSLGVADYLVEIGGELRGKGKNIQGKTWAVGIEQPSLAQQQNSQVVVALDNRALATSGDYRNFHTDESGKRLSHIINPKTQQPISHNLASISVVADNTMTADGLATGLYVLGETEALRVAEREKLAIFLIVKTPNGFETKQSSEFDKFLIKK
ncbi:FAD:protein FMN transferase [Alysiella filiformis]|uniref:FAD:protein FMN transferase n=1 Tax=Alysiella filiformis DSM 16848 TaxID=1120981 RepID=A0A286E9J7_9NEIS|nr:FAD:protein FMN transferase [Alysiella filiformis]QMT31403.1 FAD:protein FMN transferase [Alysiella filiformis]UBQ55587.1 FAD:protein FMN transferase [Alysiella filiformis DSM 16848]SOD67571.1 thiamine biosynthesis lipoprotein [Alysiella filiformis DSM 16848]